MRITNLADGVEDVRFALIVSVGSNTEIDLLGIGRLVEGNGNTQNRILWTLVDMGEPGLGTRLALQRSNANLASNDASSKARGKHV